MRREGGKERDGKKRKLRVSLAQYIRGDAPRARLTFNWPKGCPTSNCLSLCVEGDTTNTLTVDSAGREWLLLLLPLN